MGKKFQEITKLGIICDCSQVTIPGHQKGFVTAYIPKENSVLLMEEINRYTGIIAFISKIDNAEHNWLYVTYINTSEDANNNKEKMVGRGVTHLGCGTKTEFDWLREWLGPSVKKIINREDYVYAMIVNPCYDSPSEYCIDVLLEAAKKISQK